MKICVDENIPLATVSELRSLQHDVLDIRETPDRGMPDDLVWELVTKEEIADHDRQRLRAVPKRITQWVAHCAFAAAK